MVKRRYEGEEEDEGESGMISGQSLFYNFELLEININIEF